METELEKSNCVRNQLLLWENLLEVRIKLQKCLITSNQMPQYDIYNNFKTNTEYMKIADEVKNKLKTLLNNMLQLQNFLLKQCPKTKHLSTSRYNTKRKAEESKDKVTNIRDSMDEEIPSDTEDENENKDDKKYRNSNIEDENKNINEEILSDVENENEKNTDDEDTNNFNNNIFKKKLKLDNYEKMLNNNHKSYINYRNSIIQKWNEKTKIASGKLNKNTSESTLKQIEFALNDKQKLRNRSRLKRSEYKIIGKSELTEDNDGRKLQEYDSEIYDDDDFYHQLLRDLIEYKSSDITDPVQLSKQWIKLQNMRHKMKRKIDTRATKGRRIRYNVHNKLINFMAPITINDIWTDHAKNELYNSLFGKIKLPNEKVGC